MKCPICNGKTILSKKYGKESIFCPECNEILPSKFKTKNSENFKINPNSFNNGVNNYNNYIYLKTNNYNLIDD